MAQDCYTGAQGTITYAGSTLAALECDITVSRGVASSGPRMGKQSAYKVGGVLDMTGTIKRIQVDGELLAALMTGAPTTGTAETLKDHVAVAADGATSMDDTTIATASRIRATVETSAITTGGTLDIVGEDANGVRKTEVLTFGGAEGIGEYETTLGTFKKVYYAYVTGIRSTGVGTIVITSITGDASADVGEPKYWNLVVTMADGSNNVIITANNCFFTGGSLKAAGADKQLLDEMTFTMRDPDTDLTISYVNA